MKGRNPHYYVVGIAAEQKSWFSYIPADHNYTQDKTVFHGQEVNFMTGWVLTPLSGVAFE